MFDGRSYEVRQKIAIGNKYRIYEDGEPILESAQKKLRLKEDFRFTDPETGETLATIRSKSKPLSVLRHLVGIANLIPNKYEIFDAHGAHVGDIEGAFSLRDAYTVTIDDASGVPKEAVIAAACILDALENQ